MRAVPAPMAQPRRLCLQLLVVAAMIALQSISGVECHGWLQVPPSRNWVAHTRGTFFDQMGGNGLGLGAPPGRPNPFGDPFQGRSTNFAGQALEPQVTYTQGQVIQVRVTITAPHGGKFTFRVCPRSVGPWTQDCFDQPAHFLTRVENGATEFWLPDGALSYTLNYRLPPTINCPNGCVLQWQYVAMQHCIERGCNPAVCGAYAQGVNLYTGVNIGFCGDGRDPSRFFLENFYNGADVRILASTPGTPVTPPPTTPVTPPPTTPVTPPPTTPTPGTPSTCPTAPGTARAACICQGRAPGYYADVLNRCVGASWCYVGGSAYITCPTGLMWDSRANTCNFPAQVTCA